MGRILALDYGKKRVGIAVSDPMGMIANGLATVSESGVRAYISEYLKKETVDEVVVGYPFQMNNQPSEAVQYIDPFIRWFKKKYAEIPLVTFDERFTSKMALQAMRDGGLRKKGRSRKGLADKVSAVIILQSYLDSKMRNRSL